MPIRLLSSPARRGRVVFGIFTVGMTLLFEFLFGLGGAALAFFVLAGLVAAWPQWLSTQPWGRNLNILIGVTAVLFFVVGFGFARKVLPASKSPAMPEPLDSVSRIPDRADEQKPGITSEAEPILSAEESLIAEPEEVLFVTGKEVGWQPPPGIVQVQEPLEALLTKVQGLSQIRSQAMLETYLHKWYAVNGTVREIIGGPRDLPVQVFLDTPGKRSSLIRTVSLLFPPERFESISHIDIGYRLGVAGQILSLDISGSMGDLTLYNCQVLEASAPMAQGGRR